MRIVGMCIKKLCQERANRNKKRENERKKERQVRSGQGKTLFEGACWIVLVLLEKTVYQFNQRMQKSRKQFVGAVSKNNWVQRT